MSSVACGPVSRLSTVFVLALTLALAASACSSGADPTTTTAPTTTAPPTSTSEPPTTTRGVSTVTVTGDLPAELLREVSALYSFVADERNDVTTLPPGLVDSVTGLARMVPSTLTATGTTAELPDGDAVATVRVGDDAMFAAEDISGWHLVGAGLDGADVWLGDGPRMLLVLGSDARSGQNQLRYRADSIHVVTVVPDEDAGAIVGIPRDSWIESSEGTMKFSSLMSGRGPEIMLDTTRDLTGLTIEGYVVTGFEGFTGLIDTLGRLAIDLPRSMHSGNNWDDFPEGEQELSPTRALQLARIRKGLPRGDFARSFNQGLIMQAAMAQIQEMGVELLPAFLVALLENAATDLSTEQLLAWAASVYFVEPDDLVNVVLPGRTGTAGGGSVVFLDEDGSEEIFRDLADGVLTPVEDGG